MPALWTYPWDLYAEDLPTTCADLAERGITAHNVATHYHSVRSMCPRSPSRLFESYPGGCYVPPDSPLFEETPIDPIPNPVGDVTDPLGGIVDEAAEHGLSTNAWVVCFHNTRLGAGNPAFRIESAFGDAHDHSLCPSQSAVGEYFQAVVDSVAARGVDEIQLETVGFPSAFHPHGSEFGHDKRHALTGPTEEALISQCFCDGCLERARAHQVDIDAAMSRVRAILQEALESPAADLPPLGTLLREEPVIADLFDFRRTVINDFVAGLAEAAGGVPLNYYVMEWPGFEPGDGCPAGVHLPDLGALVDRMTALCYVSDPAAVRRRVRSLQAATACPVDAGVTLDPAVVDRRETFEAVIEAVREVGVESISIYHHSLLTPAHLDWISDVFADD